MLERELSVMKNIVQFVNRYGTDCVKWDGLQEKYGNSDMLSMWVADMDFRCPECVHNAIKKYMECGAYGYDMLSTRFYKAFIQWEKECHGYEVEPEWIRYSTGVVQAFYWCIVCMTKEKDSVLVLPPVYYPFFDAVNQTGRTLVESDLAWNGEEYRMDYADIEKKISENNVKMLLFCSPHNPIGRVWKREELEKLSEICQKHNVIIVSDEIHHDFVYENFKHIPMTLIQKENTVILTSASKTFNLAGLTTAVAVIPDDRLRKNWDSLATKIHIFEGNSFGYLAGEAAYLEGKEWIDQVKEIIYRNYIFLRDQLLKRLPKLEIAPLEGTYLMWVNFGAYLDSSEVSGFFEKECKIALDYGEWFHGNSETWVRFNLATSDEIIEKAAQVILEQADKRNW